MSILLGDIGAVQDIQRWTATGTPQALGDLGMDVATGRPLSFIASAVRNLAHTAEVGVPETSLPFEWDQDSTSTPLSVTAGEIRGWRLRDNQTEGVQAQFRPRSVNLGVNPTLQIPLWVTAVGPGDGNVRLQLTCRYIAAGELVTKAADETLLQTVAIVNTLARLFVVTFTLAASLMAADDVLNVHLERLGTVDPPDTFTGDIAVVRTARFDFTQASPV